MCPCTRVCIGGEKRREGEDEKDGRGEKESGEREGGGKGETRRLRNEEYVCLNYFYRMLGNVILC